MGQSILWGSRVGIRRLRPRDAWPIRKMMLQRDVAHLLFEEVPSGAPGAMTMALYFASGWLQGRPDFAIVSRSGKVIGRVHLWRVSAPNRSAMLTIFIGDTDYWGKGCGTEALRLVLRHAFGPMKLHRIELNVFDFNLRAIRSYQKVGFVREGVRRQSLRRGSKYHDMFVMGILRDEFLARERQRRAQEIEADFGQP